MRTYTEERGRYIVNCYEIEITDEMKNRALQFAKDIILTDNQYSRLLPGHIQRSGDVSIKHKLEIQRTYVGKLGEMVYVEYLREKGKKINTQGMFEVYEGQENVDDFDFTTKNHQTVDVKTGFRTIHKRLLVNVEQFENLPKDYYVAVKLNARDIDIKNKLVNWDSITKGVIKGYAEYTYMRRYPKIGDFGEGDAYWIPYDSLMGIDRLLNLF